MKITKEREGEVRHERKRKAELRRDGEREKD